MGSSHSISVQPIEPLNEPICATEPRFCLPHNVRLRFHKNDITDASNEEIYFRFETRTCSLSNKKVLRDCVGYPVLNMKNSLYITNQFNIFAGDGSRARICKFRAFSVSSGWTWKSKLCTVFTDIFKNGIQRHLILEWSDQSCTIYLGARKRGGILLARIVEVRGSKGSFCEIEIAGNVDIAICCMMFVALRKE